VATKRKTTKKRGERGPDKKPRKKRTDGQVPPIKKKGSTEPLPKGSIRAIRAVKLRVPDGASEEHSDLAEEAFQGIVGVMRGDTKYIEHIPVHDRLRAMTIVREEVCGPIAQKVEVTGTVDLTTKILEGRKRAKR
jgi:hypothetical protein